jgi:hypothetical protein
MGLKLRYNLFHSVTAPAVYGMLLNFYAARGRPLQQTGTDDERIDVHEADNNWVVVSLDSDWEWKERREAQLYVSQRLSCLGFLIFVYDGDYWGYEFFARGEVLDQFTQESNDRPVGFAKLPTRGNAAILAAHLPALNETEIAPYLIQQHDWQIPAGANTKAWPGDEYNRFDECAVLDFLRMLGICVNVHNRSVQLASPCYRSVWRANWSAPFGTGERL